MSVTRWSAPLQRSISACANSTLTMERVAVLAALTIAAEAMHTQTSAASLSGQIDRELKQLNARLDAVLRSETVG
jgi:cell division protein ZapA (FtsZ GTPase activity inhibitor)